MAYLPNIPQSTDQLSVSQGNILNNFSILGAIAGNANPSSTSINTSSGFNWIYLPSQGAIPPAGAAFSAGNIGLYSAINTATTFNELYINKTITGPTVVQIPMTAYSTSNGAEQGWSYLPSGVKIAWGFATIVAVGFITITYNSAGGAGTNFPGFTAMGTPIITRYRAAVPPADAFVYLSDYNNANFTVYGSTGNNNISFSWMAIGI
jgi:hypothetical protein